MQLSPVVRDRFLGLLAVAGVTIPGGPAPARADDEGSEHTASLVGAAGDTLGVVMRFEDKAGWSMDFRPKPGADSRRVALPFLPADHAHYEVVVGAGRTTLAFVMTSRERVELATAAIWTFEPNAGTAGTVTHRWTMGDLFTAAQLGKVKRSISHYWWQTTPLRLDGGRVIIDASGRAFAVDPVRGTLTVVNPVRSP